VGKAEGQLGIQTAWNTNSLEYKQLGIETAGNTNLNIDLYSCRIHGWEWSIYLAPAPSSL